MVESTDSTAEARTGHRDVIDQAAAFVFRMTCGAEIESCEDHAPADSEGVIVAVISLVGDVDWSVFLCLPRQTAEKTAAQFAGFEIPFDSDDMGDAIGELTNIFAGQVKAVLDQQGVAAEISLPTVIRADAMEMLLPRNAIEHRSCFQAPMGRFWTGMICCSTG